MTSGCQQEQETRLASSIALGCVQSATCSKKNLFCYKCSKVGGKCTFLGSDLGGTHDAWNPDIHPNRHSLLPRECRGQIVKSGSDVEKACVGLRPTTPVASPLSHKEGHCVAVSPQRAVSWAPSCVRHLSARYTTYSRSARPPWQDVLVHVMCSARFSASSVLQHETIAHGGMPVFFTYPPKNITLQAHENVRMFENLRRYSITCTLSLGPCLTTSHC